MERERSYLCVTEIEVYSFGVSNVKDAIGLWREAGANLKRISKRRGLSCDKYCHTQEFVFPICGTSGGYTWPPVSSRCFFSSSIVFGVTT